MTAKAMRSSKGVRIGCETGGEKGHGRINMKEAFAHSCNSYFIQLGREVGYDEIYKMAKKMGFGSNLLEGYPQEHSGHMMTAAESSGAGIGNLSIGQGPDAGNSHSGGFNDQYNRIKRCGQRYSYSYGRG